MLSLNATSGYVLFPTIKSFLESFVTCIIQEVLKFLVFTDNNLIFNIPQIQTLKIPI